MNITKLHDKLIAAARAHPPSDHVPYSFEKRIMAHLNAPLPVDQWALWSRALWRAAAPCVAIAAVLAICAVMVPENQTSLSQDLENTVYSQVNSINDGW
jgi:anti-sigma-K factor RskA